MADTITIELDSEAVQSALERMLDALGEDGLRAPLAEIGEALVESTKQRFVDSQGPDGMPWEANAESTLLGVMRKSLKKGEALITKRGNTRAKAVKALARKRPLVDTGNLATQIRYQLGRGSVSVGTNRSYSGGKADASVHQYGTKDGRIPARPFLGLSASDEATVLEIIRAHVDGAL